MITGQDGSYLAELLLDKGYEVHGRCAAPDTQPRLDNIAGIADRLATAHRRHDRRREPFQRSSMPIRPDEIYNLAAMSQVRDSYDHPEVTQDINAAGLLRILEACRTLRIDARIYQACSSEMFGKRAGNAANGDERHRFIRGRPMVRRRLPRSITRGSGARLMARKISCGILFNHESPRRGDAFLSRKVCKAVAEIACGRRDRRVLGNLDAKRDWGLRQGHVGWIHAIVRHFEADDFVIATGETPRFASSSRPPSLALGFTTGSASSTTIAA